MPAKRKFTKLDGFKFKPETDAVETAENAHEIIHDLDYIRLVVVKQGKWKYCWKVYEFSTGVGVGRNFATLKDAAADTVDYVRESIAKKASKDGLTPSEVLRKLTSTFDVINPAD